MMTTDSLRDKFLKFFEVRGAKIVESDSLVPKDDPTLLFTCAGMNQFKKQFMGHLTGFTRAASSQKCLRTDDLDEVGKTAFHHTFFEMLGNFSFGDYFKKEAISWAWEFLTKELNIDKNKLQVSVYLEDNEAFDIWNKDIGLSKEKIARLGAHNNFWPADAPLLGPNGPCGPCSEIFFDKGKSVGCKKSDCGPACSCGRFVEIWNLVFTQFNRVDVEKLEALPNKNIDTGMGLERMASVMQNVDSNFDIDIFKPITQEIKRHIDSVADRSNTRLINIIADHIRAISFSIADGVMPSNEKRGYVVRKLIRKSVLAYKNLGVKKPLLFKLVGVVSLAMKSAYPELNNRREDIASIILSEEQDFLNILSSSADMIKDVFGAELNSGFAAFKLYDTYGIPLEITSDWAKKNGKVIDLVSFNDNLNRQKEASKKLSCMQGDIFVENSLNIAKFNTEFKGYDSLKAPGKILKIFKNNLEADRLSVGEEGAVILSATALYGESGGQAGDSGKITCASGTFVVMDAKKEDKAIIHLGKVIEGFITTGDNIETIVDAKRRSALARAHTGTHLMHASLRKVLGEHVRQAGSLVEDDRLRFDFTHFKALTFDEVHRVESLVKEQIKKSEIVSCVTQSLDQAKKTGALMFFAEKYESEVRVIEAGSFSKEFCGGTHLKNTKEVIEFKIIQESSIAKGVRRIEALTGKKAIEFNKETNLIKNEISSIIRGDDPAVLNSKLKNISKRLSEFRLKRLLSGKEEFIKSARDISGLRLFSKIIPDADRNLLRSFYDNLTVELKDNFVIALGTVSNLAGVDIIVGVSKDAIAKGLDASKIIKPMAARVGGSGGGRPDFAQAGGSRKEDLELAMEETSNIIKGLIK